MFESSDQTRVKSDHPGIHVFKSHKLTYAPKHKPPLLFGPVEAVFSLIIN